LKYIEKIILIDNGKVEKNKEIIYLADLIHKYQRNDFNVENYVLEPVELHQQGALVFMSSGTTGLPKGVEVSHRNLISCILYHNERTQFAKTLFGNMVSLNIAPYFHAMGFIGAFLSLNTRESAQVFLTRFEPRLFFECIQVNF
jgi:4-coumarate--CoA ligase